MTICPQVATIRCGDALQSGSAPGEWRITDRQARTRPVVIASKLERAGDARGTPAAQSCPAGLALRECASSAVGQPATSPSGRRAAFAARRSRSGAQPTASLTTTGRPAASASLTTSPHVSDSSLGSTRQSAIRVRLDRARSDSRTRSPSDRRRASPPRRASRRRADPIPRSARETPAPSVAAARTRSSGCFRSTILPANSGTNASGAMPSRGARLGSRRGAAVTAPQLAANSALSTPCGDAEDPVVGRAEMFQILVDAAARREVAVELPQQQPRLERPQRRLQPAGRSAGSNRRDRASGCRCRRHVRSARTRLIEYQPAIITTSGLGVERSRRRSPARRDP